jgi:hypothetical protein
MERHRISSIDQLFGVNDCHALSRALAVAPSEAWPCHNHRRWAKHTTRCHPDPQHSKRQVNIHGCSYHTASSIARRPQRANVLRPSPARSEPAPRKTLASRRSVSPVPCPPRRSESNPRVGRVWRSRPSSSVPATTQAAAAAPTHRESKQASMYFLLHVFT